MTFERHRIEWRGRADEVCLLSFMPRFPHRLRMVPGADGWWVDLHLPEDARIEYRIEVRRGARTETTLDPSNPDVATNPFGANSILKGSKYVSTHRCEGEWRIEEFRVPSAVFGGRRHHRLLSPMKSPTTPLPLVLLHDGADYVDHARIPEVLASAMRDAVLPPLRVALLDPRQRNVEYAADPRHARHVVDEVLPRVRARVAVAGPVVIGGASLGAVAAWHTAQQSPGVFGGLVLQSGTFAFSPHSEIPSAMASSIRRFLDDAVTAPAISDLAVGQTCGRFESLLDWNRTVAEHLGNTVRVHSYEERWAGHDWGAWADTFVGALATAIG
ncbi:MAG: alpha/beta hydrolase-fold protein [Acidimicrobiia bacterium]